MQLRLCLVAAGSDGHNPAPVSEAAPAPVLQLDRVSRKLAGHMAVDALSLTLARGEVLGLLGINGAGKSTSLRMIAGVLAPDTGKVLLHGVDLYENPQSGRRGIGYLPERAPLHAELSVGEYLRFCARLHGLSRAAAAAAVEREVERCDLGEVRRRLIGQLSKGFQQRVGIAQALLHEPALVVLDEPASGLDPVQSLRMRALVASLRAAHAVILSTHLLAEAEAACDRIAVLHRGSLRHLSTVSAGETARLEQRFLRIAADLPETGEAA
jgi:ABC-2 type transport system ATP-binding protein